MVSNRRTSSPVCVLLVHQGGEPEEYHINEYPCRIGRGEDCDIVISEPSISSLHAILVLQGEDVIQLEDQWSTNGIYLDDRRVTQIVIDRRIDLQLGRVNVQLCPFSEVAGEGGTGRTEAVSSSVTEDRLSEEYFYRRDGDEFGPHTRGEIRELHKTGKIKADTPIWAPGATSWLRADCVPAVFGSDRQEEVSSGEDEAGASSESDESSGRAAKVVEIKKPRSGRGESAGESEDKSKSDSGEPESRKAEGGGDAPRRGIVCPHCWHRFDVEEFLFIARHQSLVGDPVLGQDAQQRFLPSRFTATGNAVDSAGMSCPDMACPRCHLRIPQPASEMPPLFLSIVGATASGKSYFLTAMTWQLRNSLSQNFAVSFTDTDAVTNQILNDFEETIFLSSDSEELIALRKTELQGDLYNQILLEGMLINLPRPFMFSVRPAEHHPDYEQALEKTSRTLVLYDNAGEHFEPGMDSVDNPTTQHLLHSDTIFFLFDPTKDVRFRDRISDNPDPQLAKGSRVQRQEIILTEMINRIKKYSGMRAGVKTAKSLIIIVSKCDTWIDLLGTELSDQPWQWEKKYNTCALDIDAIKNVSFAVRFMLQEICPEVVSIAESLPAMSSICPTALSGTVRS